MQNSARLESVFLSETQLWRGFFFEKYLVTTAFHAGVTRPMYTPPPAISPETFSHSAHLAPSAQPFPSRLHHRLRRSLQPHIPQPQSSSPSVETFTLRLVDAILVLQVELTPRDLAMNDTMWGLLFLSAGALAFSFWIDYRTRKRHKELGIFQDKSDD